MAELKMVAVGSRGPCCPISQMCVCADAGFQPLWVNTEEFSCWTVCDECPECFEKLTLSSERAALFLFPPASSSKRSWCLSASDDISIPWVVLKGVGGGRFSKCKHPAVRSEWLHAKLRMEVKFLVAAFKGWWDPHLCHLHHLLISSLCS